MLKDLKKTIEDALFVSEEKEPLKEDSSKPSLDLTTHQKEILKVDSIKDEQVYTMLKSAINYNPNDSLSKFTEMLDSLKDVIADESVRYVAAGKALSKFGITTENILSECSKKIEILKGERVKFDKTMKDEESSISSLVQHLSSIDAQIAKLEDEKVNYQNKITSMKEKLGTLKSKFSCTSDEITSEITQTQQKIEKYLGGKK